VTGYARAFEANVRVIATQSGQVVADAVATAADWQDTWGEFRTTVVLPPGEISMLVGEEGTGEGQIVGPTISLTVR
jgi:hypothetical protein